MIDLQAIPEIAKHPVDVLTDVIQPIASDPRVKKARRKMARSLRRSAPRTGRPMFWVLAAGMVLVAAVAMGRVWKRHRASTDLGPDVDVSGVRDKVDAPRSQKKRATQPAA